MLQRVILSALFATLVISSFAQVGTIKGNVKDAASGEAVVGANIYIMGTTQGSAADLNGDFEITNVKAGTHNLIVSFISYKTDTLENVKVYPDQTTVVNTTLAEESQQLGEVVVRGAKVTNTDFAVITEIRKNDLVAVGISAQQISMSQDRDAAQIMKRIPGVTILNNRFVNVRGLSERYSTVLLNGVIAPSTEVDSKAFAFDLIPSNMIDRMLVYKSGSAELPGEFAGAVINISTKNIVDEEELSVNVTTGFRMGTTFKDFKTYEGSKTDWLGYDNGTRQLPGSFPSQNLRSLTSSENLSDISRSLPNNWATTTKSAIPDYRFTLNFAKSGSLGSKRLSNVTSIAYTNTKQYADQNNYYYDRFNESTQSSDRRYYFQDNRYEESVRVGVITNFVLELNPSHKIEFRNLLNQQGVSQVLERSGTEDANGIEAKNLSLNYNSRRIYTGQLSGKHSLNDHINADWVFGVSSTTSDQPDYRRIRSQRPIGSDDNFSVVIPSSASSLDGRFYSDLGEEIYTHALNLTYKLNPGAEEKNVKKIGAGYYLAQTNRDFKARWFSYKRNSLAQTIPSSLLMQPFTDVFASGNIGAYQGESGEAPYFILEEGTNLADEYTGENLLAAGYINTSLPVGEKFRVSAGARVEYNRQQLKSFSTDGNRISVDNPITSVMPFGNFSYNFSEKTLLRLAYSKTINRPVFRELAPFTFYDFDRNADFFGNPDLKTADIHNVDLRWEKYPSSSESILIGVFYKYFSNPIEQELKGGSNIIYTYRNGDFAQSYGAEVEVRKSLKDVIKSGFVDNLSVLFNATFIESEVDLGDVADQRQKRALQGQSPYVINGGLYYNNVDNGWQFSTLYNVFGKRIFAVGDLVGNSDQYELPRHQLDITVAKRFSEKFEAKLGIQDVLNQPYRLVQDSDDNTEVTSVDEPIRNFKNGQYITLGFTYRIR